ncbi:tetratricopeptide repeat protein [Myroides injenensis]|uniref:type IX secretion system periplasmic lipoprotein PorW/SprE n=1 Tax=Myroides injenensis TaxID=1183151 RepID=UPI0004744D2E|nr:sporulation protein [Myroides injenensis]
MKNRLLKYSLAPLCLLFVLACSVKKDRIINRGYHAMTTKYNILYNGYLAYDEALLSLQEGYFDNFWEILPVERIEIETDPSKEFQVSTPISSKQGSVLDNFSIIEGESNVEDQGSTGFARAEDKATKAIQKHSMYIKGRERNWQMDEAYLLLGKARYFDGRFIPALEAFNYILYKYPDSDKINEAKVWREKANLRLSYDDIAIKNLNEFVKDKRGKMKKSVEAEANAILAQAYINIENYEAAISPLKTAIEFEKSNKIKSRYLFILGQLYARINKKAEAHHAFEQIINMKRKAPKPYSIHAYSQQFGLKEVKASDSIPFLKLYRKLLADRENRPYLDILNRQVGLFYEEISKDEKALEYLKKAVKAGKGDQQLKAYNYLSIAEIYFNNAGYANAGSYYDSALSLLPEKAKERLRIVKRRDALRDVVAYEKVAHTNDSILRLVAMNEGQRFDYFQKYVDDLRKEDFRKLQATLKGKKRDNNADYFNMPSFGSAIEASLGNTSMGGQGRSSFYFYSTQASSYGKLEFKKKWGNRALVDNWRLSSVSNASGNLAANSSNENTSTTSSKNVAVPEDNRYNVEYYVGKIPTDENEIAILKRDRDYAYFQLGSMYSERFKKYDIAAVKFEDLLTFEPAKRLVLPSMYKLYKIYLEIDMQKALVLKARIISEYPASRYAKLLQNIGLDKIDDLSPEQLYTNVFRVYSSGEYEKALKEVDDALERYDDDYVSKFELLKAQIIARLQGIEAYKDALNFVALTYSSSPEGKEAENILSTIVPELEGREFTDTDAKNWKIVIFINSASQENASIDKRKFIDFATYNSRIGISYSEDYYKKNEEFIVLHGFKTKEDAEKAISTMGVRDAYAISAENYIVVQIKKNWNDYLAKDN